MTLKKYIFHIGELILFGFAVQLFAILAFAQPDELARFKPLETTQSQIENELGDPVSKIGFYSTFRTEFGSFFVWYTTGTCTCDSSKTEYKVPANRLHHLLVYPTVRRPISEFIGTGSDFRKSDSPSLQGRRFYTSIDESITYQTVSSDEGGEIVFAIDLMPSTESNDLRCDSESTSVENELPQ